MLLSFVEPIGDAVRPLRSLADAGDAAADTLRAVDASADLPDVVRQGRNLVEEGLVDELRRHVDELEDSVNNFIPDATGYVDEYTMV